MGSYLKGIQAPVIKYANIISQILQVEVEIVDENLIRIAGTGIFKNKINEDMSKEGYVYKKVLKHGKDQIIYNPGKDELCIPCPSRDSCGEKFEMSSPIKLNNKIIGVIGLICFEEKQKEHLLNKFDIHMAFLRQISEFISIAAHEKKEEEKKENLIQLLNTIVDKVEEGVLILDKEDNITHINQSALKYLNISSKGKGYKVSIEDIGDSILEFKEYIVTIENEQFNLLGSIYPVNLNETRYDRMFFFHDLKEFKEKINKLSGAEKHINCNDIIGNSKKVLKLKETIKKVASSISTILITGESGTGKEMIARAIHNESNRIKNPFVAINCAAIPESLLESELFGYVRGAFTGADSMGRIGKFELANRGTIFLDEVGDMPLFLQAKLLRVLQERKVIRIGSNTAVNIDVRVIAATNKDLISMIKENKFREDLYFRLNVIPIESPPLRDRLQDIKMLTEYFLDKYLNLFNKRFRKIKIDEDLMQIFYSYNWPGNIRELENTIEFMVNMMRPDGILTKDILPQNILYERLKKEKISTEIHTLKELEKRAIYEALNICGWSTEGKKIAALKLGIGIATLYRKIEEYNLSK